MDNFIQKVPLLDLIEMCKQEHQLAKDELYRRWEIDWEELKRSVNQSGLKEGGLLK